MKTILVDLTKEKHQERPFHFTLSFARLMDHLKQRINQESGLSRKILNMALDRLSKSPAFNQPMSLDSVKDFEEQLQLIYSLLVPALQQKEELIWGLSSPLLPVIFYGTDLLYDILLSQQDREPEVAVAETSHYEQLESTYRFILERLYGLPVLGQNNLVVPVSVNVKGFPLTKYYQIHIDSRFADVTARAKLPSIDEQQTEFLSGKRMNIEKLSRIFPLEAFHFEGFSVVTATDVTQKHALEMLKSIILSRNSFDKETYFEQINATLKALVGDPEVEFGLMPFLKVNDKLVFNYDILESSKLIRAARKIEVAEATYLHLANRYIADPEGFAIQEIADTQMQDALKAVLYQEDINSFSILPVYHDNVLCGVLEGYSKIQNGIATPILKKLESAMELLGRAYEHIINAFETEISSIILEKFTSLQPAVTWKFKNAAWNHLRDKAVNSSKTDKHIIEFKDVYPQYAAIDIRGSTIERNKAVHHDLRSVLTILIGTLTSLKSDEYLKKNGRIAFRLQTDTK